VGVSDAPLWEVQWHGTSGQRVRRFYITRRKLRWLYALGALLVLLALAVIGAVPVGVRGYLERFTVKAVRQENKRLAQQQEQLWERAWETAQVLEARLRRAVRLAWILGAAPPPLEALPPVDQRERVLGYLLGESKKLVAIGENLVEASGSPCSLAALPTAWPLDLPLAVPVGRFGVRVSPFTGKEEPHYGLTLAAPRGTKVLAAGEGRVAFVGTPRERRANIWTRLGTLVVLDHGGGVASLYGHLDGTLVRGGQQVKRGQVIATAGASGWTRVAALYFEVRWPVKGTSVPVDPLLLQLALPLPELAERLLDPTAGLGAGAPPLQSLVASAGPRH